jgi:hypothetical protein
MCKNPLVSGTIFGRNGVGSPNLKKQLKFPFSTNPEVCRKVMLLMILRFGEPTPLILTKFVPLTNDKNPILMQIFPY